MTWFRDIQSFLKIVRSRYNIIINYNKKRKKNITSKKEESDLDFVNTLKVLNSTLALHFYVSVYFYVIASYV